MANNVGTVPQLVPDQAKPRQSVLGVLIWSISAVGLHVLLHLPGVLRAYSHQIPPELRRNPAGSYGTGVSSNYHTRTHCGIRVVRSLCPIVGRHDRHWSQLKTQSDSVFKGETEKRRNLLRLSIIARCGSNRCGWTHRGSYWK